MDLFSTVHDPVHCSAHGLPENFFLLNFRLHKIFVESNNTLIGVQMRKLWSSEVVAANSQGVVRKFGDSPVFHYAKICSVPGHGARSRWSWELINSVHDHPTITNKPHNIQIRLKIERNLWAITWPLGVE